MKKVLFIAIMVCVGCTKQEAPVPQEEKPAIQRQVIIDGETRTVTEGGAQDVFEKLSKPQTKMPQTKMPKSGEPIRKDAVKHSGKTT